MTDPVVTVRGEAIVPGRPDVGIWTVEVSRPGSIASSALAEVAAASRALESLFDELGIATEKRSTSGVTVHEEFDNVEGKQEHRGFRATSSIVVRIGDASVAATLVDEAVTRAGASVQGPTWFVAPDNPARLEACRGAAQEATRKAEAYAAALGLCLGAVSEIREVQDGVSVLPRGGVLRAASMDASVPVDSGDLNVVARVDVTFHLEV
jgi:uncharacterized protein